MKKQILALVGLVFGVIILGSCSGYDLDEELNLPPVDNNNTPDNPNKNDEWESVLDDWYEMVENYTQIESHKKTNKAEYIVNAPFSASLGEDLYFKFEDKGSRSEFISLENVDPRNTSYGEWYNNSENDSIREVKTTQDYKCNLYNRVLTVKNAQAYRLVNGQRDPFMMPTVVTSFAGHSSDVQEIERNDSTIINRETIKDSVRIAFANRSDIKPFYVSATTIIDYVTKVKPENNDMPEPTYWVEGEILWISSRTASPIYKNYSKKDQGADWYGVDVIKTTKKTYTVANGVMKDVYDNSELADATWNSCVYDAGYTNKWVPCNITPNDGGWTYTLQFSDGTARVMDVPMNQACIDGLKSFQKDHNAAQTPFLDKAAAVKKPYANGVLWTVNANGVYSYTVAGK